MRAHARRLGPVAGVAVLAAAAFGFYRLRWPVRAAAAMVEEGAVVREAAGAGTIESEAQVSVAFTISGRIARVAVEEGQAVRAGDVLATLETDELTRQISAARQGVVVAASGVGRNDAEIQRARVALEAARRDRQQIEALHASGAIAPAELDVARERVERAEAELEAAVSSKRQAAGSVSLARANLDLTAQRSEEAEVRSPFDGIVVRRLREPGDVVAPAAPVLVVASTRTLWARIWLDESVLGELREGQPARVALRGDASRAYRARLDRVAVEADRQTHEVLVDLELLERPARIVLGQRADGFVELATAAPALRVPQGACDLPRSRCFVDRGGRVDVASVRFGLEGTDWIAVEEGLARGDVVLLPGPGGAELPIGRRVERAAP